jgi:hypothetical protein
MPPSHYTEVSRHIEFADLMDVNILWTGDDPRKLALLLILALDDRFNDTGMIGSKIDEAVSNASLAIVR